ncbi:MAG: glutathione peroxidase [Planctomycetota bacterium]|nr:glutathione peroxidase [Planctomycetota bacterium]
MFQLLILLTCLLLVSACSSAAPQDAKTLAAWEGVSLFELEAATLAGDTLDLSAFRGKPVLVVNTASECGLTPQYEGLQQLHETYAERGLVVLGFPCNQFLGQEPGSPEQIATFCRENYGVTFQMMDKVEVNAGEGQHPVYGLLGTRTGSLPDWNFAKYLVSPDGETVQFFGARTDPLGDELTAAIEAELARI